jgi:HTH-type transcriptional regulator/antitoxin HigA
MNVRPIKTEADYRAALAEIERLFDARPGTTAGDRLEILATLVPSPRPIRWRLSATRWKAGD